MKKKIIKMWAGLFNSGGAQCLLICIGIEMNMSVERIENVRQSATDFRYVPLMFDVPEMKIHKCTIN